MGISLFFLLCHEALPPPRIFLEPTFPVKLGDLVKYECVGAYGSLQCLLLRVDRPGMSPRVVFREDAIWEGRVGWFFMDNVAAQHTGIYTCVYYFNGFYSKNSNELPLIIRDVLESPFLWVSPSTSTFFGQSLTFHCNSTLALDKYYLYHGSIEAENPFIESLNSSAHEGQFYYPYVHRYVLGQYLCMAYNSQNPYLWTGISNKLLITAGAPPFLFAPGPHLIHMALTSAALGELLA
ncbi:natural cytotoxicity triggering receptor 1-like [Phascolarctos cinereus]